jgi:hypothetical protein
MRAHVVAVFLHDFARHRARDAAIGEIEDEDAGRLREPDLPGVSIERLDALERRVVVEAVLLARLLQQFVGTEDHPFDLREQRRGELRIHQALHRIHVVVCGELALLAAEGRIVVEEDPRLHAQGERLAAVGDLGQCGEGVGLELQRPREVVVLERRVEHGVVDHVRIQVGDLLRIERGLRDLEGHAEDLVRIGRQRALRGRQRQEKESQDAFHARRINAA